MEEEALPGEDKSIFTNWDIIGESALDDERVEQIFREAAEADWD